MEPRAASGSPKTYADDARSWKVGQPWSTQEVPEGGHPQTEQFVDFTGVNGIDKPVEGAAARDDIASHSLGTSQPFSHRLG